MELPKTLLDRITWVPVGKYHTGQLPTIQSIQPLVKKCENGCGKIVDTRQVTKIQKHRTPVEHWQQRCLTCDMYKNPLTNTFTVSKAELHAILTPKKRNSDK